MPDSNLIARTVEHVRSLLSGEGSGHDWWHTYRVWKCAQAIGRAEGADPLVVELAALLHDVADWKAHGGDATAGPRAARAWLAALGAPDETIARVAAIVADISFKGADVPAAPLSLEGRVVQDADRLDAIGAVGVARCFAYGGAKGRAIHDPDAPPQWHRTAAAYLAAAGTSVNHFYEKLLLLKDRMHTASARALAERRHRFMEDFLRQFYAEWEGG